MVHSVYNLDSPTMQDELYYQDITADNIYW